MNDTIAAIATPRAAGGISVIRISGSRSLEITDKFFRPVSSDKIPSQMKGYTCAYGNYFDEKNEKIDDGIVTVFRSPRSYTGEDMTEVSCHGGIFVTQKLLRCIYSCGARPAEPGEFTKRAFLNGKMSLTQAESVMDIISADGENFYKCAESLKEGSLFKRISEISQKIIHILGDISAWVDYPEEDISEVNNESLITSLKSIADELNRLASTYDYGRIIRQGIDTVICGKPNVGKSTIMNLLAGCERSIVTDIAGTTRDVIEESVRIGDIVLRLSDTAGIRETSDKAEKIGISLAEKKINSADLIFAVFDGSRKFDPDDEKLCEKFRNRKNVIAVINKSDMECIIDENKIRSSFKNVISISAVDNVSISVIESILEKMLDEYDISDNVIIANERQKSCVDNAIRCVNEAVSALQFGDTLDAVEIIIEDAENHLLELTGERISEVIINEVFSRFCVGK